MVVTSPPISVSTTQCTERTAGDTSYMSAIHIDVNITIHGTLVVACKDKTYVVVGGSVVGRYTVLVCRLIIPCAVDINIDGASYRHIRCTYHTLRIGILTI